MSLPEEVVLSMRFAEHQLLDLVTMLDAGQGGGPLEQRIYHTKLRMLAEELGMHMT